MYRVAFFWVGDDTNIPKCYVDSIRIIYGDGIEILQLSDENTESVSGVNTVIRKNLPDSIMLARLEAYSQVRMDDRYTFFTDADSLLINQLNIESANDILLTPRILDFPINPNYPEHYEEFEGKMIGEVMPFLFGAIALRGNNNFFKALLAICEKLPTRFHRWYGDQYALHKAVNNQLFSYDLLDPNIHLRITKTCPTIWELSQLRSDGVQLITFKGPDSNKSENMPIALKNLRQLVQ